MGGIMEKIFLYIIIGINLLLIFSVFIFLFILAYYGGKNKFYIVEKQIEFGMKIINLLHKIGVWE